MASDLITPKIVEWADAAYGDAVPVGTANEDLVRMRMALEAALPHLLQALRERAEKLAVTGQCIALVLPESGDDA